MRQTEPVQSFHLIIGYLFQVIGLGRQLPYECIGIILICKDRHSVINNLL